MGAVMPKIYGYLFLSIICLLINLSVFANTLIADGRGDVNNFLDNNKNDDYGFTGELPENANATVTNFILSSSSSFIPFFSLLSLALLGEGLPMVLTVFTGIIIGIISALQVIMLTVIILNLAPKVLGSGFDV